MLRRLGAVVVLSFLLVLLSFGMLIYGASSFQPGRILPVSPVEKGAALTLPHPPPLESEQLWAAARAEDPWPDLTTRGGTGNSGGKVALTFDDGPDPRATPLILDVLREYGLKATFFVVGRQVAEHPELLRRIVEEGHTIGNHTYDHADMSDLSSERMRLELRRTQEAVDAAIGYHYPMVLMRPPYGNPYFDGSDALPAFQRVVRGQRLIPVTWTVDPRDYLLGGRPKDVVQAVVRADESGRKGYGDEVILLHDNQRQAAEALPGIIDYYERSGRRFADVDGLLADKYVDP
ncbi:MAG: polysaccharide deacetylase family protein [Actinomycetota bacterium]|nr:polysaccharide deacetylase family protein [Actinomycetota bacterium]